MKKIFLIILVALLCVTFVACSNPQQNIPEIDNESSNELPPINAPPETPIPPSINNPSDLLPLTPIKPATIRDLLIHINADYLNLYSDKKQNKWVGSVRKNDMLPLLYEETNYYVSKFNHKTIYIKKSSNVSLKAFSTYNKNVENVINIAKSNIGTKYVYGAERYHFGNGILNKKFNKYYYDCSSFVQHAYFVGAGVKLGVTSRAQAVQGYNVSKNNLVRGDLMFFTTSSRKHNTGIERIGHVAIYLGDNYILHTSHDYAIIEPISNTRWANFVNARRVL